MTTAHVEPCTDPACSGKCYSPAEANEAGRAVLALLRGETPEPYSSERVRDFVRWLVRNLSGMEAP